MRALLFLGVVLAGCESSTGAGSPAPNGPVDASAPPGDAGAEARPTSTLLTLDLPPVMTGTPVSFTIPEGALGFDVIAESAATGSLGILSLIDPGGHEVLQQFTPATGSTPTALNYRGHIASAPVPQTDAFGDEAPLAGSWTATTAAYDASGALVNEPAGLRVLVQTTDHGTFHGGLLDLHIHLPAGLHIQDPEPDHVVDAQSAAADACIRARLAAFFAALKAQVGLDRGAVTFHALDAKFAEITGQDELDELFRQSSVVADSPSLHFMFTNALDIAGGKPWGVAAAIGGAATRTGTALSGVALAVNPMNPARGDGLTMLHESGHFVGLGHTTELGGKAFDPLADTPACPTLQADGANASSCPDHLNLMFPTYWSASNGGKNVTLSPAQKRTYRGSPLYRAYRR